MTVRHGSSPRLERASHIDGGDPAAESPPWLSADCARVGESLSRLGDKWTVLVVMLLSGGPCRFSELKREIGGVSQRMLTLTLRALERDGLATRTVYATAPLRVDYELTDLGHSLCTPLRALGDWAFAHLDVIDQSRRKFDRRKNAEMTSIESGTLRVVMHKAASKRPTK